MSGAHFIKAQQELEIEKAEHGKKTINDQTNWGFVQVIDRLGLVGEVSGSFRFYLRMILRPLKDLTIGINKGGSFS
ncbi:MAG: hypothetical protein HRT35_28815 [Algicola sp.]|nr:hypothetical protein [Algicola sp.]